ncbi:MAG: CHC2 zinc finger domain-containing protein [Anaerolineales bacterium]
MNRDDARFSFKRLKQKVSIAQVLDHYRLGEALRLRGDHLVGPCPVHRGDNPSAFRVNIQRNIWHCFTQCNCGGDVVDLVRQIENCDFPQAARRLARIAHHRNAAGPAPVATGNDCQTRPAPFRPFRTQIPLNPNHPFLQKTKGIAVTTALDHEIGHCSKSTFLKGTIAVRLHDLNGQPLGYCGRRLDPQQIQTRGKWRFPRGLPKSQLLYNAHRIPKQNQLTIVVECPFAAIRIRQAGFQNAVALLGTATSKKQLDWLAKANALILMLDGDKAGQTAANRIASDLKNKTNIIIHRLPKNSEPEDQSDQQLKAIIQHYLYSSSSLNPYQIATTTKSPC